MDYEAMIEAASSALAAFGFLTACLVSVSEDDVQGVATLQVATEDGLIDVSVFADATGALTAEI
jgi:hypothetical protein